MEETQIILKNETNFAQVVKLFNGIEVGSKRVKVDHLLYSLFDMMGEEGFADLVLKHRYLSRKLSLIPRIF